MGGPKHKKSVLIMGCQAVGGGEVVVVEVVGALLGMQNGCAWLESA